MDFDHLTFSQNGKVCLASCLDINGIVEMASKHFQ